MSILPPLPPPPPAKRTPHLRATRLYLHIQAQLDSGLITEFPWQLPGLELATLGKAQRLCQETMFAKKHHELHQAPGSTGFTGWKLSVLPLSSSVGLIVQLRQGTSARSPADPQLDAWLDRVEGFGSAPSSAPSAPSEASPEDLAAREHLRKLYGDIL